MKQALSLGLDSFKKSNFDQAKLLFQKVLQLDPNNFFAFHLLGIILLQEESFSISQKLLLKAVSLQPKDADANHHLGLAYKGLGQKEIASKCFLAAINLKPSFAVAHLGYADVSSELGRYELAIKHYLKAIKYDAKLIKAHNNLGSVFRKQSKLLEAINCYKAAYKLDPSRLDIYSNVLMGMASEPSFTAEQYIAEARKFGKAASKQAKPYTDWPNLEKQTEKLRVGLVSGDLRKHSVAYFLMSWIDKLDPKKVELFAYSNYPIEDEVSEELKPHFVKWTKIAGAADKEVAHAIYEDRINILIDLSGHTAQNRLPLFAWKAAPIQISWMGFFASSGVEEIDYFIGDQWNFPEGIQQYYVEKAWRLNTSSCFSPPKVKIEVECLPALENGYITFGCFHKVAKLNNDVLALWSDILHSVPNSKLIVKDTAFVDSSISDDLKQRLKSLGIDADRIICEVGESREAYFSSYNRVDLCLDPFPFNGGTVNMESLWMGVPFVSLLGQDRISRRGAATLYKAGLDEFVAESTEEYIEIVKRVCTDINALSDLRKELRHRALDSSLYNGKLMAKDLEGAFFDMWSVFTKSIERV
ncbi:tetratricopeptide repeat protein [Neptuniibacter sp. PT8_73]|uniref:O-linked N-acetylglucosamine transferase, SPINDLY family protein n=1 Tax=Neptuniibacter sp. PT8_73 TaxID=3398206 RepID=UPI0039F6202C